MKSFPWLSIHLIMKGFLFYGHLQKVILDRSLCLFQELHTIRMELKWDGLWNWWCWFMLVLKIVVTYPTLAKALSTDFSSLRSINLSRGLVMDGWHFGRHREWKVFLVPLLTCKSPPQQHFEGQAASYWDRRRALRAKEPWKGPEQNLATNKMSFTRIVCSILHQKALWHSLTFNGFDIKP